MLGSPRSGTTLLSAMLSCHPEISLLNEDISGASTRIFSKRIAGVKLCVPHQIEIEQPLVMRARDYVRAKARPLADIARRATGRAVPNPGFVKSALSIRDYQARYDDLAVLGIIRSPDQVIASIMRRGHQTRRVAEYRWRRLVEILHLLATENRAGTRVRIVHFDDLVAAPEDALGGALAWLGCDFVPEVLDGFRHTPQYRGRTAIDPGKSGPGLATDLAHPLLAGDAALAAKYRALNALARPDQGSASNA